jgi:hypothetical protein
MKKLIAAMFVMSLLAMVTLSANLLADCEKDHEGDGDNEESVVSLLAHCGECGEEDDHGDDDEDSLVRSLVDCGKDHGDEDDEGDDEDSLV